MIALAAILLRQRRPVILFALAGLAAASLFTLLRSREYTAEASFVPQATERSRAGGIAGLAGQLGIAMPGADQALSPEFYAELLQSRTLLGSVATDTLSVPEVSAQPVALLDLIEARGGTPARELERGIEALDQMSDVSVSKLTGIVTLSVTTPWPSASAHIARSLLARVADFNLRSRQSQAAAERRFLEGRLEIAKAELLRTEARLEEFLRTNRQYENSPQLAFARERLQREVSTQQQVYLSLTQNYEDARIREVRDTPVFTIIETPAAPTQPDPQRRIAWLLIGLVAGALMGIVLALVSEVVSNRREESPEVRELLQEMAGVRSSFRRLLGKGAERPQA